jgi:ketosteroid isomerase-like protein
MAPPARRPGNGGMVLVIVLALLVIAGAVGIFATVITRGNNPFGNGTPQAQVTPTSPPAQDTPTVEPTQLPEETPTPQATATPTPSPTPSPTPATTPEQQAQAVIEQYYAYINSKDYSAAYDLWVNYPKSKEEFAKGFENTERDDIQFGEITKQSESSVKLNITVTATEKTTDGGTKQTVYTGYYVVAKQADGAWKINEGQLNPAT